MARQQIQSYGRQSAPLDDANSFYSGCGMPHGQTHPAHTPNLFLSGGLVGPLPSKKSAAATNLQVRALSFRANCPFCFVVISHSRYSVEKVKEPSACSCT